MTSVRRNSDSIVEKKLSRAEECKERRNTTSPFELCSSKGKLFFTERSNLERTNDFPELKLTDFSLTNLPKVDNKTFYISKLDEGFANAEVVTDYFNSDDFVHDFEQEIFTATPLKAADDFPERLQSKYSTLNFPSSPKHWTQHESNGIHKPIEFKTTTKTESDSESDDFFTLFSDTSSGDEEYQYSPSPNIIECDTPTAGNLPFLDKLDAVEKDGPVFKPPLNPLVSKRTPTATIPILSEPSLVGAAFTLHTKSLETEDDTFVENKEKQKTSVTTAERNLDTFCSTNVQSALLTKITPHSKVLDIVNTSFDFDFPRISSPVRAFRKVSKSSLKVKPATKLEEEMGFPTRSYRKTFEGDIRADLENFETEVDKAFEESVSEGSFMPLLKQELQCKIQVRRLSRGQPELVLEPEEPKKYELTPEEIKKKNARLEQNRKSARRARFKARTHEKRLLKTIKNEMTENARLTKEVTRLRKLRDEYKEACDIHLKSCTKGNIR